VRWKPNSTPLTHRLRINPDQYWAAVADRPSLIRSPVKTVRARSPSSGSPTVMPDTMNRDGIRSSAQFPSGARGVPRELPPTTAAPQPHARWCGALWEQLGLRRPVRPWWGKILTRRWDVRFLHRLVRCNPHRDVNSNPSWCPCQRGSPMDNDSHTRWTVTRCPFFPSRYARSRQKESPGGRGNGHLYKDSHPMKSLWCRIKGCRSPQWALLFSCGVEVTRRLCAALHFFSCAVAPYCRRHLRSRSVPTRSPRTGQAKVTRSSTTMAQTSVQGNTDKSSHGAMAHRVTRTMVQTTKQTQEEYVKRCTPPLRTSSGPWQTANPHQHTSPPLQRAHFHALSITPLQRQW